MWNVLDHAYCTIDYWMQRKCKETRESNMLFFIYSLICILFIYFTLVLTCFQNRCFSPMLQTFIGLDHLPFYFCCGVIGRSTICNSFAQSAHRYAVPCLSGWAAVYSSCRVLYYQRPKWYQRSDALNLGHVPMMDFRNWSMEHRCTLALCRFWPLFLVKSSSDTLLRLSWSGVGSK